MRKMSEEKPKFKIEYNVQPSIEMLAKIESIIEECVDKKLETLVAQKITETIETLWEKEKGARTKNPLVLRKVPLKKAINWIKVYIDEHQGCRTSDIIYDLALDPDLVLAALKKLERNKAVRGDVIEQV